MPGQPRSAPTVLPHQQAYASLIIRLWQVQKYASARPDWRSEVEHIQSGGHWEFASLVELEGFIQQFLRELAANT